MSLVWCGDTICITGTSHDDCTSLICSVNSNGTHSSQNHPGGNTKDCSCVCHVPSIVSSSINVLRFLTTQRNQADIVLHIPSPFGSRFIAPLSLHNFSRVVSFLTCEIFSWNLFSLTTVRIFNRVKTVLYAKNTKPHPLHPIQSLFCGCPLWTHTAGSPYSSN